MIDSLGRATSAQPSSSADATRIGVVGRFLSAKVLESRWTTILFGTGHGIPSG